MSNILVTGGAGFIGFAVASRLAAEETNSVTILDDFSRGIPDNEFQALLDKENVKHIAGDMTDKKVFESLSHDFDYIYHFAAVIGVRNVTNNPDRVLFCNGLSILNLFEYIKDSPAPPKVLFSSTSEVYAGTLRHFGVKIPTNEEVHLTVEDVKAARASYAISKIFGESVCFNYGKKYAIPFTIVRYHNVYGPRMGFAHVIPELFLKMQSSNTVDLPSPDHSRAFCFIDDAVEMTIKACASAGTAGEIVNIGNQEEEISIRDLALRIAGIVRPDIVCNEFPEEPGSPVRRCPDTTKISQLTGYRPKVSLDVGLAKTYAWYKGRQRSEASRF